MGTDSLSQRGGWIGSPLGALFGDDDDAAGALAEDGLQGLVVERAAVAVAQADDHGGGVDQLRLVGDLVAGLAGADALDVAGDPLAADQLRLLDLALRLCFLLGQLGVERQVRGHGQHRVDVDAAAALGGELDRGRDHLLGERLAVLEGDQDAAVLDLLDPERLGQQHLDRLGQRQALVAAVEHVDDDARTPSSRCRPRACAG